MTFFLVIAIFRPVVGPQDLRKTDDKQTCIKTD